MRPPVLIATAFLMATAIAVLSCANGAVGEPGAPDVPPDSPLAQVGVGMRGKQVLAILGEPDDRRTYLTDKAWRLFYWGRDTHRAEWIYAGEGSVVFTMHERSGALKVIRVVPELAEPPERVEPPEPGSD